MLTHITQIDQAKEYVTRLYQAIHHKEVVYYTLPHALCLHEQVKEIAEAEGLEDSEKVEMASLFYYSTYWTPKHKKCDRDDFVKRYINEFDVPLDANEIIALMNSIDNNSHEKSQEESVLYDAFYSFLGKKNFIRNLTLKAKDEQKQSSAIELRKREFQFMIDHNFRTKYAIKKFGERKSKNIYKLQTVADKEVEKQSKRKKKDRKLGRGIDTMYKSVYRNHINLSEIADGKANLIISVNTIILSIIVTLGGTGYTFFETGFFKYARFTVPILVLLLSSLTAVILAILSARPNVTKKKVNRERLLAKKSSILFFGNFATVELQDFVREMSVFRQEQQRLYDSMSVDIYQLGIVLHRKYRLVQISYNVFMMGLAISVLSFLGIFIYSQVEISALASAINK